MALCPGSIMASGIINETSATNLGQGVVTRPVPFRMSEMFARHRIHTSCRSAFLCSRISRAKGIAFCCHRFFRLSTFQCHPFYGNQHVFINLGLWFPLFALIVQKRHAFAPRGGSVPDSSIYLSSIFQLKRRTPTDRTSTTLFKTCFAGGFHSTGRPFDAMSYTRLPVSG
ncbi:hypothetical protein ALC60_11214 [Trachymyrmex zeteki]|uniref:Uncharacterized protein n=1 Tax=Mycetomoellerius zeteki TaxID=64791 RepID=A0A151WPC6_9HYME|nr:hypothetical protein ALC60_11214 [Trachymyrmex zeteki]